MAGKKVAKNKARALLKDYKIVYDDPYDGKEFPLMPLHEMPQQARILHDSLLDFTSLFPDCFRDSVIEKQKDADPSFWVDADFWYHDESCDDYKEVPAEKLKDPRWGLLKLNQKNCLEAKRLSDAQSDMEYPWQIFYETRLFHPLEEETREACGPRRFMKTNHCYENFLGYSQRHWNKHSEIRSPINPKLPSLWQPRPDYALHFPVSTPTRAHYAGFMKKHENSYIGSLKNRESVHFPSDILDDLSDHGLQYSTSSSTNDMNTYPWFVAEFKKKYADYTDQEYCYCQGLNAASVSLAMYENAARYSENIEGNSHVPAIPVMTAIGPKVLMWVAFPTNEGPGPTCRMTPIWRGDMTSFRSMLEMRIVLENAHTWAMHVLRPYLATCIDQWRYRFEMLRIPALDPLRMDLDIKIRLKARLSDKDDMIQLSTKHSTSGLDLEQEKALLHRLQRLLCRELEPHLPEEYFRYRNVGSRREGSAEYNVAEPETGFDEYEIEDDEEFARESPNRRSKRNDGRRDYKDCGESNNISHVTDISDSEPQSSNESSRNDEENEHTESEISERSGSEGVRGSSDDVEKGTGTKRGQSKIPRDPSTPLLNRPKLKKASSEPPNLDLAESRKNHPKRRITDAIPFPLRSRVNSTNSDSTSLDLESFSPTYLPSKNANGWIFQLEREGLFVLKNQINQKSDMRHSIPQRLRAYLRFAIHGPNWSRPTQYFIDRLLAYKSLVGHVAAWDIDGKPLGTNSPRAPIVERHDKKAREWHDTGIFACVSPGKVFNPRGEVFHRKKYPNAKPFGLGQAKEEAIVIYEVVGLHATTSLDNVVLSVLTVFS